jgi:hypothetical protein
LEIGDHFKPGPEVETVRQKGRFVEPIKKRLITAEIASNVVRKTGLEIQSSIIFANLEFIEPNYYRRRTRCHVTAQ